MDFINQLPSGFSIKSTYRALRKAWIGFRIAKRKDDHEKMKYYVESIQKFERQLGLHVSSFSDIVERTEHTKTN